MTNVKKKITKKEPHSKKVVKNDSGKKTKTEN